MSTPYLELLHDIVDRLRSQDPFASPPAILVLPEADEPSEDRPGQGDNLQDQVETALGRSGVAVIVYMSNVTATEEGADLVDIRVQVAEHTINNRAPQGTRKSSWELLHGARSCLEGWKSEAHPEWSPLMFEGISTITTGLILVREVSFRSMIFMSTAV